MTWTQIENRWESNWNNQRPNINLKTPTIWGKVSDYERLNEGNWETWMNGWKQKKGNGLKAATSQCYTVSVCLRHHDRSATVGEPWTSPSMPLLTGASHADRQSQGLSCPQHITAPQSDCLSNSSSPRSCFHHLNSLIQKKSRFDGLLGIWEMKVETPVLVLRNQKPSCLN